ncbi:MAG: hypothetical protein OEY33_05375 [Bdellovibrionales bacterium]|jgi:hypothetical protein|nr:hypothetical protein [Bdellovibrionales bacterium]
MKGKEYFVLYNYLNPSILDKGNQEHHANNYFIQECFSRKERVDKEQLIELYHEMLYDSAALGSEELIGPFQDKSQLNRFCQELLQKLKGSKVFLFSTSDFNSNIQKSDNIKDLEELFINSNEVIINQKIKNKPSFLQKFFD